MKRFFNSWLNYARENSEAEESISSLASTYKIGRRQDFRISYPSWGDLGYLPQIFIQGQAAAVYDIGLGGLGLIPKGSESSGEDLDIEFRWPEENLSLQAKAKAIANYKHSSHIQFKEIPPPLQKQLQSCLLPKLVGQRFQLVRLKNAPFQCIEEEIWISPQSETLLLQKNFGIFRIDNEEIHVEKDRGIFFNLSQKKIPLQDRKSLAQLLICLASIQKPSRHLSTLQDYIYDLWGKSHHV